MVTIHVYQFGYLGATLRPFYEECWNVGVTIKTSLVFLFSVANIVTAGLATAQSYPAKPIRMIVTFSPGSPADIVARGLVPKLTETFKQPVVIDNRAGGGGTIGTETAVRANPDGYTLVMVAGAYATNAVFYKLPYDPLNEVMPVAQVVESGFVITLHSSVPATNIKELIAYDKANPGKLNYGTGGLGSTTHLATELFNQMAGTRLAHVPYKGQGLALNDLLGGQIPHIRSNRLRGIAVTSAKRSSAVPEIPTVSEALQGYEASTWYGILGPKALPIDIVLRWNKEINRFLQLSETRERMASDGMEPAGGLPEQFRDVIRRDIAKWQKVVRIANIRPEG
jgi:tripartite-type tricarboxylate transporter receptor subunit TctC